VFGGVGESTFCRIIYCSLLSRLGKPFIAKLADITSRPVAYAVSLVIYVLGFVIVATSKNVTTVAVGELFYSVGSVGLDFVTDVIVAGARSCDKLPRTPWLTLSQT